MSNITACDSGTSEAPNTPCSSRKSTICGSDCARPQATEAMVKPATATMNSRVRPKRVAKNPVGAVMIAAATM